uniref:Protein kinase domain-containing protein n=1 Tax=Syphacia muris TaxID=451379 RepID=A0A0N5AML5_9BILA
MGLLLAGTPGWRLKSSAAGDFMRHSANASVMSSDSAILQPTSNATPQQPSTPQSLGICQGCVEVKKELQEFKEQIERSILLHQLYAAKSADSLAMPLSNTATTMPRNDTIIPECPVAIRPLPTCSTAYPFLQWNPWLLQQTMQSQGKGLGAGLFQLPQVDTGKQWNSPNSVDSGHKSDCSSTDGPHIDPVGIEVGETSPVSSSSSEKHIIAPSPETTLFASKPEPLSALNPLVIRQHINDQQCLTGELSKDTDGDNLIGTPQHSLFPNHSDREDDHSNIGLNSRPVIRCGIESGNINCNQLSQVQLGQHLLSTEQPSLPSLASGHLQQSFSPSVSEKKKTVPDDCLKLIRRKGISKNTIENIKIPVPQATKCDPGFTAASEEEIIQQFMQNRRCDDDVCKAMTFLSKMLAEKRVFGTKLMAETTVAGPNHSTYKNLPEEGIHYIAYVCRKVMRHRIPDEEQFWDVFRDVTRKLAARCRRVRHSRKSRCDNAAEVNRGRICTVEHNDGDKHLLTVNVNSLTPIS